MIEATEARIMEIEADLHERLQDVGTSLAVHEIAKVLAATEEARDAAEKGATQTQSDHADTLKVLREARQVLIDHVCKLPLSKRDHGPVLYRIDAEFSKSGAIAALLDRDA